MRWSCALVKSLLLAAISSLVLLQAQLFCSLNCTNRLCYSISINSPYFLKIHALLYFSSFGTVTMVFSSMQFIRPSRLPSQPLHGDDLRSLLRCAQDVEGFGDDAALPGHGRAVEDLTGGGINFCDFDMCSIDFHMMK